MAELADALDLGSSVLDVQVQLLLLAPFLNLVRVMRILYIYQSKMIDIFFNYFIFLISFFYDTIVCKIGSGIN